MIPSLDSASQSGCGEVLPGSQSDISKAGEVAEVQKLSANGAYIVDKNIPETFLNLEDLERVTESNIHPQKRSSSFLHTSKIPHIPSEEERQNFLVFSANYLSSIFLWWLYPIVRTGYKRTIQPNYFFKVQDSWSIEVLFERFDKNSNYYFKMARTDHLKKNCNTAEDEISEMPIYGKVLFLELCFTILKGNFLGQLSAPI